MAGARMGFLAGPPALMRGCLQLKAAITRLNTNLVAQRGALAALRDGAYRAARRGGDPRATSPASADAPRARLRLAVRPQRGLACALELDDDGPTAQELMVALFARRVAVYPGDGLGDVRGADDGAPEPVAAALGCDGAAAMWSCRDALAEAAAGRWRSRWPSCWSRKGSAAGGSGWPSSLRRGYDGGELMAEYG